jgi:hypothetical protein
MVKLLLWCILFCLCWPLALVVLAAVPLFWFVALPFRLLGFVFHAAFSLAWLGFLLWLAWTVVTFPFRFFVSHPSGTNA